MTVAALRPRSTGSAWLRPRAEAAIPSRIAALEAELATLRAQLRDEADARLLRAIALASRGAVFSVGDVLERRAIDPDLRAVLGPLRPKQIGRRLARCVGRTIAGLSVRRVIVTKNGWVWEIHINHDAGAGD